MRTRVIALACTAALLSACGSLQTPYQRPALDLPAAWEQTGASATASANVAADLARDPWWQGFGDTRLTSLMKAVLERNNDLAAAALRVRQAQLQAGLTDENRRPNFGGSVGANRSQALDGGGSNRSFSASLGVSYELDLWGRLARESDAAQWTAQATEQDRHSAALALVGTTTRLYWQLGYLNQRLDSGAASLADARRTRELVQAQYDAGAVSGLELREAEQGVLSQQVALEQLQQQRVETRHALALLLDVAPSEAALQRWLPEEPDTLNAARLPDVAAGLPADLLARRPDLRAAEARLQATLASGDATRASYYPSLSLTGSLGSASTALGTLLSNPVAALGASLALPLLNQQRMRLDGERAQAQYDEAAVNFRQTLYTALGEVEDALSARTRLAAQAALLERQLATAREVERLYETRYRAGAATLKLWLDAQQQRRSAELALAENRFNRLAGQVTLYQALGGDARGDASAPNA